MISPGKDGVYLDIKVQPGSKHPGVWGVHDGRLRIAVAEAAAAGRANTAAVVAVSRLLAVPVGSVTLVGGFTSRQKRLFVAGLEVAEVELRLGEVVDGLTG